MSVYYTESVLVSSPAFCTLRSVTNSLSSRKVRQEVISAAELSSPGGKEAASKVHATYLATSSGVEATPPTTTWTQR